MKKIITIIAVAGLLLGVGCKNKSDNSVNKYEVKSGIVEYNYLPNISSVLYFDDYGNKECIEMIIKQGNRSSVTRVLFKDDYIYTLNLSNKSGTKMKADGGENNAFILTNFNEIKAKAKGNNELTKIGSETFLGLNCDVYKATVSGDTGKAESSTLYIYKGLILKMVPAEVNMPVIMEATRFQPEVAVSSDLFSIPSNVVINEVSISK